MLPPHCVFSTPWAPLWLMFGFFQVFFASMRFLATVTTAAAGSFKSSWNTNCFHLYAKKFSFRKFSELFFLGPLASSQSVPKLWISFSLFCWEKFEISKTILVWIDPQKWKTDLEHDKLVAPLASWLEDSSHRFCHLNWFGLKVPLQ